MSTDILTAELIRELLSYEVETGIFKWKKSIGARSKVGKVAGCLNKGTGYYYIKIFGKSHFAHRLAWLHVYGHWPDLVIDHINGIIGDNRICNLRDVDRKANSQNQLKAHKNNLSTGLIGAAKNGNKFRAAIRFNGVMKHIGNFNTPQEAHLAYIAAKRVMHVGCTL